MAGEPLIEACSECQGQGTVYDPHCGLCKAFVPKPERGRALMCGHAAAELVERRACDGCEGTRYSRTATGIKKLRFAACRN